ATTELWKLRLSLGPVATALGTDVERSRHGRLPPQGMANQTRKANCISTHFAVLAQFGYWSLGNDTLRGYGFAA
ncbi:MAG TPA: hypothetical protein VIF64_21890, partial [Pyrinomonadaceae bacterium]